MHREAQIPVVGVGERRQQTLQMNKREKAKNPTRGHNTHTLIFPSQEEERKRITMQAGLPKKPLSAQTPLKPEAPLSLAHVQTARPHPSPTQTWRSDPFAQSQQSETCVCNWRLPVRFVGLHHMSSGISVVWEAWPAGCWTKFLAEHK